MKSKIIYKVLLAFAILAFFAVLGLYLWGHKASTGPFLVGGLLFLTAGSLGFSKMKGFSYSFMILTAVSLSMYYPRLFLGVGSFEFKQLIVPLLQVIMFGMGSQMSLSDFAGVIKMPKGVIAGVICQFTIMPVIGITVASLMKFPPEIAAGIILVGSSPSGMASNVMSFIAKANLALSVTLTAFATLLSPLLTPLLMKTLAGQYIEINFWEMMIGIFNMVILPICAGLIFNLFAKGIKNQKGYSVQLASYVLVILIKSVIAFYFSGIDLFIVAKRFVYDLLLFAVLPILGAYVFTHFTKGDKKSLERLLSFISMLGIGIIITVITAAGRDSLLDVGLLLILACFIHNIFGYSLGYGVSKLLRMNEQDCRTIALEVGMQNGGLASGLAMQMGKVATVGLAPAIFGPMMNITGSSLASWWRGSRMQTIE